MNEYFVLEQQYPRGTVAIQKSLSEYLRIQRVIANMAYQTDVKIYVRKSAGKSFLYIEKGAMGSLNPNGTWHPAYRVIGCKMEYNPFASPSDAERAFLSVDRKIEEVVQTSSGKRTYLLFDGFMNFEEISEKEYFAEESNDVQKPFSFKTLFKKDKSIVSKNANPFNGQPKTQPEDNCQSSDEKFSFCMKIEDKCEITGRGTVVTGRIESGEIHAGQEVEIVDQINHIRIVTVVVGIEKFGKILNEAKQGDVVGILLRGLKEQEVSVGSKLVN